MTKTQRNAVETFRKLLEKDGTTEFPTKIERFEITEHSFGVAVSAETRQGTPGNMLYVLSYASWLVFVGKRGRVTVKTCPTAYKQFAGRKAFGMYFDINKAGI